MEDIQQVIKESRKIVIKIGSNTLALADGTINRPFMDSFAQQCRNLIDEGKQICLVSSGAGVAGVSTIHKWARKKDIHYRQALCSIGQVELMDQWRGAFSKQGLHIGQLLLTKEDFSDEHRSLNIRNTLFTLVDEGVIPIVNENDSVCCDEIRIGDNDNLSALTVILWGGDLLILFSDIDGVYDRSPKEDSGAKLIPVVEDIQDLRSKIKIGAANEFGTGGIETKIHAAEKTTVYGIPMILSSGKKENCLKSLTEGTQPGTLFLGK